jgi:hypothetical protein
LPEAQADVFVRRRENDLGERAMLDVLHGLSPFLVEASFHESLRAGYELPKPLPGPFVEVGRATKSR